MAVYSFSIKPDHLEGQALVLLLKRECRHNGIDFSKMVLDALEFYKKEKIDGNKSRDKNQG